MNPADLPNDVRSALAAETLLAAVREVAQGPLRKQTVAIDRDGVYPLDVLKQLGALGGMSAHLDLAGAPADFGLSIRSMAEVSRVCGATGFMMWCQAVCGLYLQQSGNPALTGDFLQQHASGLGLGGTALSNPMKTYAQIETLMLKATPVEDGFHVNGSLPWVSNLGEQHYFGAIAAVQASDGTSSHELMFLARCNAPGLNLRVCPSFSAMEGTGTFGLRFTDYFVAASDIIANPAKPYIGRIRGAFVMLQCGMGLGVTQGAIDSMADVEKQLGHVNQFLNDRPDTLQVELDGLQSHVMQLAKTPFDQSNEFFSAVLSARAQISELCLRAAQSALLHQGARGYLLSSSVQRRVRESHFVAIVTPAIKHLRKEIARLAAQAKLDAKVDAKVEVAVQAG